MALWELAIGQLAGAVMAAVRALEALGPSPPIQRVEALVFGAIELEEFAQADPSLERYRIACHDKSPFLVIGLRGRWYQ